MNSEDNPELTVAHQKAKNLVRSEYYDVKVKVDEDVYHLDKLQLALKSDYFEKLFVDYSDQEECSLIELPVMDTDTFSTIVDIMYEQDLMSVLNHDNYVTLLMAMDYLQMEIDLKTYADFIDAKSDLDMKIFGLYNFVRENPNLQCLLPSVLKYLSDLLADMQNIDDLLYLPLDHIVQIVSTEKSDLFRNDERRMIFASEEDRKLLRKVKGRRIAWSEKNDSSGKDMRKISYICSKWICYDSKSRLPHAAKLVNAAKRRFHYLNEIKDEDFIFNSMLPDIPVQINAEMMTKLFYKHLLCDGAVNPVREKLPNDEKKEVTCGSGKNKRRIPSSGQENLLKDEKQQISSRCGENKRRKLLENDYFHDIVVRVGEKTYNLHRFMLNSESGYFAEICPTEQSKSNVQTPTQQPNKNEYLLGDIDQTTFDTIVKYIYFDELQLTCETITRVLKAANILKMEKLFGRCVQWMKANIQEVCAQVFMIDECISASWIRDDIEEFCSKVLIEPETSDTLPICLVSFDVLEDLLLSSSHSCDNPHKIVDICSKWVMHDVKNRYHLIPQIALAINRNRNHYEMDASADLNDYSEQSIRDEIWKILRSTALVPSAEKMPENGENNVDEMPVFVAMTLETLTIHVLNANLEQIASLCFSNLNAPSNSTDAIGFCLAATLVDDNLFIMLSLWHLDLPFGHPDKICFVFYVYNLCLKKFICLNNCVEGENLSWFHLYQNYSLLNCRGQVYCCFRSGDVFRYSIELNRWMMFSKEPVRSGEGHFTRSVWFTSDGDQLYRLYAEGVSRAPNSSHLTQFVVEEFNFQQNEWLSLPDLSFTADNRCLENLIFIGDRLTVIFTSDYSSFMSFDLDFRTWRRFSLPDNRLIDTISSYRCFVLVQCEDRLLHVFGYKLYEQSQGNQTWELIKELPLRMEPPLEIDSFAPRRNPGPYECISAIHRPIVRTH
ncbi:uncharacterized protein LOC135843742 [Planococcus citri]|uniref:uncharacterized protein LOC135843742 n=1 Tax=Planococcus citri TaxID=170843 RepID=UPI0031F89C01